MGSTSGNGGRRTELTLGNVLDVFLPGGLVGEVGITLRCPLVGVLGRDATGRYYLAPEKDCRGGGMHSIPIHHLSPLAQSHLLDKVVKVTGVFEDGKGVTVEAIALVDEPFVSREVGGGGALQPRRSDPPTGSP